MNHYLEGGALSSEKQNDTNRTTDQAPEGNVALVASHDHTTGNNDRREASDAGTLPVNTGSESDTPGPVGSDGVMQPLAVVVPCYNESEGVTLLFESLDILEECLGNNYQLEFVLVDDCSTDNTLSLLRSAAKGKPQFKVLRHPRNYGIAAAFDTGLRSTSAELVACIDADCTYHPNQLLNLLPLMKPGVSAVTASPYHPRGRVDGVIGWRLALSKSASWIYSQLFHHKLHTYTSCFRVYRRADVLRISISHPGFVGITEILWKLDQLEHLDRHADGADRILEAPATLRRRQFGVSKMGVVKTGLAHLRLMTKMLISRLGFAFQQSVRNKRTAETPTDSTARVSGSTTKPVLGSGDEVSLTESS